MFDALTIVLVLISMIVGFYLKTLWEFVRLLGLVGSAWLAMIMKDFISGFFINTLSQGFIHGTIYAYIFTFLVIYGVFCIGTILVKLATADSGYRTAKEIASSQQSGQKATRFFGILFGGIKGLLFMLFIFHVWQYLPRTPDQHTAFRETIVGGIYEHVETAFQTLPGSMPAHENLTFIIANRGIFSKLNNYRPFIEFVGKNETMQKLMDPDLLKRLNNALEHGRFDLLREESIVSELFSDSEVIDFLTNLDVNDLKS